MLKIVRFTLIFLILVHLSYFAWQNFVPSGILKVEKKIEKQSPYFSDFYPSIRMKEVEQEEVDIFFSTSRPPDRKKIFFRRMTIDPVYFDLLMPRQFEKAKVKIKYQNLNQPLFQIGLKRIDQPWTFDFKELPSPFLIPSYQRGSGGCYSPLVKGDKGGCLRGLSRKEENWTTSEAEFILYPFLIDDRTLHFVLSSPDLDINLNEIKISDIEIILEREPWTWQNFWGRFKTYLKSNLESRI
jgi:hypothetical protein